MNEFFLQLIITTAKLNKFSLHSYYHTTINIDDIVTSTQQLCWMIEKKAYVNRQSAGLICMTAATSY